jgi:hypothetical protein
MKRPLAGTNSDAEIRNARRIVKPLFQSFPHFARDAGSLRFMGAFPEHRAIVRRRQRSTAWHARKSSPPPSAERRLPASLQ